MRWQVGAHESLSAELCGVCRQADHRHIESYHTQVETMEETLVATSLKQTRHRPRRHSGTALPLLWNGVNTKHSYEK